MDKVYYDIGHPAGFRGVQKLRENVRGNKGVLNFLRKSDIYTLYKPQRRKFIRRKTIAHYKGEFFQSDLADMSKLSRFNSGHRFILVCIDVLSKYVFYEPVKNKKADEIKRAFRKIFKVMKPKLLQTDQGTEFTSKEMQLFFKQHGVKWFHTMSEAKATLAERQIRTMKDSLMRYFHHTGKSKYVSILPKLAEAYNHTPHSRTKMRPVDVNSSNEQHVFERLFGGPRRTSLKPAFKIGDQVRLSLVKGIFEKGYSRKWTNEVFTVSRIKLTDPITYYVKDINGEEILGGVYQHEMNRVIKDKDAYWDIEKILKKRKRNGLTEYLVKFFGFKNTQWVSDIKKK